MSDENVIYVTPGGEEIRLLDRSARRYLNEVGGLGFPSVRHVTRRGYKQDGETHVASQLQARTINLKVTEVYASRQAMFDGHMAWFARFAPGADAGTLRRVLPNGAAYEIDVRFQSGLEAGSGERLGHRVQSYVLQLKAPDPIWRAVDTLSAESRAIAGAEEFSLPFGAPFWYIDPANRIPDVRIAYGGSWRAYPTVTLTGPVASPYLLHVERAAEIRLFASIEAGETLTLTPGQEGATAETSAGRDLAGRLSDTTDLAGFCLQPGINTLRFRAGALGGASKAVVTYREAFIGVGT